MSQLQPPIQLPPQGPAKPPIRSKAMLVLGIVGIVLGIGIVVIGGLTALSPMLLFLLGGGGNTDAFAEFAQGPQTAGGVIAIVGVLLAIAGIVLTVVGVRRRRS